MNPIKYGHSFHEKSFYSLDQGNELFLYRLGSIGVGIKRSALQAFGIIQWLNSQPDGLGYLNGWTVGPEES